MPLSPVFRIFLSVGMSRRRLNQRLPRYADIIEGKFIYTNIPLSLLEGQRGIDVYHEYHDFKIELPRVSNEYRESLAFDCFVEADAGQDNWLEITGILFLSRENPRVAQGTGELRSNRATH
jgi:hypothetical protein